MEHLVQWQNEMMAKFGWYIHGVAMPSGLINYHTHGCVESFHHPDFQIVLPLDGKIANSIFAGVIDRVRSGDVFTDGVEISDILANDLRVKFFQTAEGNREVLRIILPDPSGSLSEETMQDEYKVQYEDIEEGIE